MKQRLDRHIRFRVFAITAYLADISRHNILINAHMLEASRQNGVQRFLFSSSACVYNQSKQQDAAVTPLREEDAHPADPEPGYGWEKLFTEELCRYYYKDYGFETRIVRFHDVYGSLGTYEGGKEKAPAAICRKVALTEDNAEIEVWGDGEQTRSFMEADAGPGDNFEPAPRLTRRLPHLQPPRSAIGCQPPDFRISRYPRRRA